MTPLRSSRRAPPEKPVDKRIFLRIGEVADDNVALYYANPAVFGLIYDNAVRLRVNFASLDRFQGSTPMTSSTTPPRWSSRTTSAC